MQSHYSYSSAKYLNSDHYVSSVDLIAIRFVVGYDSLMNAAILLDS